MGSEMIHTVKCIVYQRTLTNTRSDPHTKPRIHGATYTQSDIHMDNIPEGTYTMWGHTLGRVMHTERHKYTQSSSTHEVTNKQSDIHMKTTYTRSDLLTKRPTYKATYIGNDIYERICARNAHGGDVHTHGRDRTHGGDGYIHGRGIRTEGHKHGET